MKPKIAIIHDWLVTFAGAEKVLEQILLCFPDADIFALVDFLPQVDRKFLENKNISVSFIQDLPFAKSRYRTYLPLMPYAIEQFDLSGYDLILSSSHAVSKGVLTGPDQLHISYVHSPLRYAWDLQHQYLKEAGLTKGVKSVMARWMLHKMRLWDSRTANGIDHILANSLYISRRINKAYRRESTVIYPPVDISSFTIAGKKEDFYLAVSRMVPYKKMPLIIQAFSLMPDKKLVMIGDGPEFEKCRLLTKGNIKLIGWQPKDKLIGYMQRAKALVFAAEEDFGITPLEAQACGTPVIAYGKGGALETVKDLSFKDPTGIFFFEQTPEAISEAVFKFEAHLNVYKSEACRINALSFSPQVFRERFNNYVFEKWHTFQEHRRKTLSDNYN
jgi:glycosyltransferase involved in cell wall biosynthesis